MSLNVPRIAAALNAYPWTPGCLTSRERMVPTYCAVGAMLRYAGVAQEHIASAQGPDFWERYGPLLQSEYGIPDLQTAMFVMGANDSARSQGEAIERVLGVLTGAIDFDALMREVAGLKPVPAPEPAWKSEPDDDAGSLALVS
jgi:hypothetical protein